MFRLKPCLICGCTSTSIDQSILIYHVESVCCTTTYRDIDMQMQTYLYLHIGYAHHHHLINDVPFFLPLIYILKKKAANRELFNDVDIKPNQTIVILKVLSHFFTNLYVIIIIILFNELSSF